jgi:hypothetical protein
MLRPDEILARLRQQPFRPFRIIASEGLRYDIIHPDLVMVGERSVVIGFSRPNQPTIYRYTIQLALVHIVGLEEIEPEPVSDVGPSEGAAAA